MTSISGIHPFLISVYHSLHCYWSIVNYYYVTGFISQLQICWNIVFIDCKSLSPKQDIMSYKSTLFLSDIYPQMNSRTTDFIIICFNHALLAFLLLFARDWSVTEVAVTRRTKQSWRQNPLHGSCWELGMNIRSPVLESYGRYCLL